MNLLVLITGILIFNSCTEVKDSSVKYKINKELNEIFIPDIPGAAIIVSKDGKVVYRNAFGLANVELGVAMKPEMCFKIGSLSKQFTAVAILMLEEQKKLSLDDPLLKYLPDYSTEYNAVKIKHLLFHTSGIKNYTGYINGEKVITNPITSDSLVHIILSMPLEFESGTKWKYSNSAYTLLASIIEKVTGESYIEFIQRNILNSLQMHHTFFARDHVLVPKLVNGYRLINDTIMPAEYMSMTHTYGAGDMISCVDDMVKWQKAFLSGKLIGKSNLSKCFTPVKLNDGSEVNYSIGWFIDNYRNMTSYYHEGGVYGFKAYSMYIPAEDLYIVILRNRSDVNFKTPTNVVANVMADIILGYDDQNEHIAIQLSDEQLQKYVGVYQFVDSPGKRKISVYDGKIYYERPPRKGTEWSKHEILPESEQSFFVEGKKSTISFLFSTHGDIVGMNLNQAHGRVVEFKKIQ